MKLFLENVVLWRGFVIVALIAAGVLAPLVFAVVPWLMLLAYVYLAFHPRDDTRFGVSFNLLLALSLPLLFEPLLGMWLSLVLALPVLPLVDRSLRQLALSYESFSPRGRSISQHLRPTGTAGTVALSLGIVAAVALALGGWLLFLSTALVTGYLVLVAGFAVYRIRRTSGVPVSAVVNRQRIVAGQTAHLPVKLFLAEEEKGRFAGYLVFRSRQPWFFIGPTRVPLDKTVFEIETSFTPPLAGTALISVAITWVDPLGLIQVDFPLDVMELLVVPRARYAEWMARKYLALSRGGGMVPANSIAATPRHASRQGIEFYGLRPYQPGDSFRAIDWKHTSKLHQVVVKEFQDKTAECAVIAVNLSVAGDEEKDKLVFDLLTVALTLARENVPSAFAAYDHRKVVETTPLLDPRQALVRALGLIPLVTTVPNPRRYLAVPDPGRIRANTGRLKTMESGAARRLAELLQMEYAAFEDEARRSPVSVALGGMLSRIKGKANIIVVAERGRDAVGLAFNRYVLGAKGYRFIEETAIDSMPHV